MPDTLSDNPRMRPTPASATSSPAPTAHDDSKALEHPTPAVHKAEDATQLRTPNEKPAHEDKHKLNDPIELAVQDVSETEEGRLRYHLGGSQSQRNRMKDDTPTDQKLASDDAAQLHGQSEHAATIKHFGGDGAAARAAGLSKVDPHYGEDQATADRNRDIERNAGPTGLPADEQRKRDEQAQRDRDQARSAS